MPAMRLRIVSVVVGLWLGQHVQASATEPPPPGTAPEPRSPREPAGDRSGLDGGPELPEVSDEMLRPLPAPAHVVETWGQAVASVRLRSTSLAAARGQVLVAQARTLAAVSSMRPSVNIDGRVTRSFLFARGFSQPTPDRPTFEPTRIPAQATVWTGGVSVQQNVLDLRSWYDLGTAHRAEAAAEAAGTEAERQALAALAETLIGVYTAERLSEVSRVSLRSNLSILELTRRRAQLGAASTVDVLRIEQEVTANRAGVLQADEGLRLAREALGVALGFSEAWGVNPSLNVSGLAADAQAVCKPLEAVSERSDVRAAALDLAVAERAEQSARLDYAPALGVASTLSYTNAIGAPRPEQWTVSALLTLPLYDGGRLAAEARSGEATASIARQRLEQTRRQATLEATQAQRAVQVAESDFGFSQQSRQIASESARLSRIAFLHGTGTSFDLVDSARRLLLADIDVTLKEFAVVQARVTALLALSHCEL